MLGLRGSLVSIFSWVALRLTPATHKLRLVGSPFPSLTKPQSQSWLRGLSKNDLNFPGAERRLKIFTKPHDGWAAVSFQDRDLAVTAALEGGFHLLAHRLGPLVELHVSPVKLLGRRPALVFHLLIHDLSSKQYLSKQTSITSQLSAARGNPSNKPR